MTFVVKESKPRRMLGCKATTNVSKNQNSIKNHTNQISYHDQLQNLKTTHATQKDMHFNDNQKSSTQPGYNCLILIQFQM
jgi:hypothetical protein